MENAMRKTHKKQAEDFIRLLEQAHLEIKRFMEKQQNAVAADLLGQCQEGAIGLGNLIEKEEGEDFPTISLLQSYCEQTFHIYEELCQEPQAINPDRTYKSLKKSLIQIENSVKNDIKVRLEVVFMPYKAAMWDSMESVWDAAFRDPDTKHCTRIKQALPLTPSRNACSVFIFCNYFPKAVFLVTSVFSS